MGLLFVCHRLEPREADAGFECRPALLSDQSTAGQSGQSQSKTRNLVKSSEMRRKITLAEKMEQIERQNREAALIILAEPERYAGLPLIWAQAYRDRYLVVA